VLHRASSATSADLSLPFFGLRSTVGEVEKAGGDRAKRKGAGREKGGGGEERGYGGTRRRVIDGERGREG